MGTGTCSWDTLQTLGEFKNSLRKTNFDLFQRPQKTSFQPASKKCQDFTWFASPHQPLTPALEVLKKPAMVATTLTTKDISTPNAPKNRIKIPTIFGSFCWTCPMARKWWFIRVWINLYQQQTSCFCCYQTFIPWHLFFTNNFSYVTSL